MVEPTSSAASAATAMGAVAVTAVMPGVNGDALIGAFAGAVVFALHAKDLPLVKRLVYMAISIMLGYMGASEVTRHFGIESPAIAAFAMSAVIVTLALASIDRIRSFDITAFWKRGG